MLAIEAKAHPKCQQPPTTPAQAEAYKKDLHKNIRILATLVAATEASGPATGKPADAPEVDHPEVLGPPKLDSPTGCFSFLVSLFRSFSFIL